MKRVAEYLVDDKHNIIDTYKEEQQIYNSAFDRLNAIVDIVSDMNDFTQRKKIRDLIQSMVI